VTLGERIGGALLRRTPTRWLVLAGGLLLAGRGLRWLAAHLWVPFAVLVIGALGWVLAAERWWLLGIPVGVVLLALGGWRELHPGDSWPELVAVWRGWRRQRWYAARWEESMDALGLIRADVVPALEHVRCRDRDLDVLTVVMAPGQIVEDWRERNRRIRSTWGLRSARCHPVYGQSDRVQVFARRAVDANTGKPLRTPEWKVQREALRPEDLAAEVLDDHDKQDPEQPTSALPVQRPGAFPRTPTRRTTR
jgi:hypothetical protein